MIEIQSFRREKKKPEVINLIIINIVVPIAVSIITDFVQSKKYKKEIHLPNADYAKLFVCAVGKGVSGTMLFEIISFAFVFQIEMIGCFPCRLM